MIIFTRMRACAIARCPTGPASPPVIGNETHVTHQRIKPDRRAGGELRATNAISQAVELHARPVGGRGLPAEIGAPAAPGRSVRVRTAPPPRQIGPADVPRGAPQTLHERNDDTASLTAGFIS